MRSYKKHLQGRYAPPTFKRKVDYIKYNFGEVIRKVTLKKGSVLEIGPGMGECVYYLNSQNINKIDIVDNDHQILKDINNKYVINRSFLNSDILLIGKMLKKYDLIILIQVLEHFSKTKLPRIIKLLYSHLNKKGEIIIVVPNAGNPLGLVERYGDWQHRAAFTQQSLKDLVEVSEINNYKIVFEGYKIPPYDFVNVLRIFFQKMLHLFLTLVMIINGGTYFKIMTPNIILRIKKP